MGDTEKPPDIPMHDASDGFGPEQSTPCSCSTCKDYPDVKNTFLCLYCGYCYFKLKEEMNVHNDDVDLESLKPFQDILPGAVGWICPPCWKNHRSMAAMKKDNKMLHEKVDNLTELIKSVLDTNVMCASPSPKRKVSRMGVEFDDDDNPSFTPLTTVSSWPLQPLSQYVPTPFAKIPEAPKPRAEVKLNLKKTAESTSTVLQEIHRARNDLPAFSGRKKKDGSHDILFKNLSDARKAKEILD